MQAGKIILNAFHEDGQISITIVDDGRGINTKKIAEKALKHGLITETDLNKMSPQEMVNLIFLPGLSTAETISDVSGRGVGMDVVKTNITKLGGHIQVETTPGQGTNFLLRLPLTLAIIPSLIVGVSAERFAIPQINLVELVRVAAPQISTRIEKVGSASVLRLRGKLLPLVRLADILKLERAYLEPGTQQPSPDRRDQIADNRLGAESIGDVTQSESNLLNRRQALESDYNILVLKVGANQFGLIVDELFDTEEIVVKPLSNYLKNCKCFAGATIMGDGRVAMILDTNGILNDAHLAFDEVEAEKQRQEQQQVFEDNGSIQETVLLFHNSQEEYFAIPLSAVLRLEKIKLSEITTVGHKEFMTYSGKGLPLIRLEHYLPVNAMPYDQEDAFLIIPKEGNGGAGIMVSQIIDTLQTNIKLETNQFSGGGLQGSAVINNHLTLFIEPQSLLKQAGVFGQGGYYGE